MDMNVNTESLGCKTASREKPQNTKGLTPESVTFTDINCARVVVPLEHVAMYATIKTDQLACINRLIADKTSGFKIALDELAVSSLASLANDLAHATNALIVAIAADDCLRMKGGAQ